MKKNLPNIVVVGKENRVCKIMHVAVPADCRFNSIFSN